MGTRLYVGNLPYDATEDEIRDAFDRFDVKDVHLPTDKDTGRPRGFAFVEVGDASAMDEMDGYDFGGRRLKVNEAKPKARR